MLEFLHPQYCAMQFHPTGTDPTSHALLVCRNARWNLLVLLAVLWAFPIGIWFAAGPWWLWCLVSAVPALLTWPLLSAWRRRGRRENWILAVYADGLWLNLRDCDYHAAESAETVVFLPYGEIGSVRRYVHRYITRSGSRTTHHKDVYLEIQLRQTDATELQVALAEEWERHPPPQKYFGGHVTSRTRRTQAPIAVEGDELVRVKFSVSNYGLRPPLKKVLAVLERFVAVDADHESPTEDWEKLDDTEFDALIRRLATNGQRFDAMKLLRERKGLSLKEAKELVEVLGKRAAGEPQ